jgi:hypothetical protein
LALERAVSIPREPLDLLAGHNDEVKLRSIHIVHVFIVAAVLTQLALAGLFLFDRYEVNRTYSSLVAHRTFVRGHVVGCYYVTGHNHLAGYVDPCFVRYVFEGQQFHAWVDKSWGFSFYVDPQDTAYRMNTNTFAVATGNLNADSVIAALLLAGATLVTVVHQVHLYRSRQRKRLLHPNFGHHYPKALSGAAVARER